MRGIEQQFLVQLLLAGNFSIIFELPTIIIFTCKMRFEEGGQSCVRTQPVQGCAQTICCAPRPRPGRDHRAPCTPCAPAAMAPTAPSLGSSRLRQRHSLFGTFRLHQPWAKVLAIWKRGQVDSICPLCLAAGRPGRVRDAQNQGGGR